MGANNGKLLDAIGSVGGGAIGQIMGLFLGQHNDRRQREQQQKLQDMQIAGSKEMMDYNYQKQMEMWNNTNYGAQMAHLKAAGLNPALIYGQSGGGATTTGGGGGSVSGASAPVGGGEQVAAAGMALQMGMQKAQIRLMEAQANKTEVEATKIGGVDTENVKADTENKILQQVINQYMGKEAADQYNRIKSPARAVEAKTYQEELEARQGIAGTIYELWTEGKLKDKSVAEIEQILLGNAKTREETRKIYKDMELLEENIKGAKLDNIINEIETKLQQQTGIDRNAPAWLKILGRLFGHLMPSTK